MNRGRPTADELRARIEADLSGEKPTRREAMTSFGGGVASVGERYDGHGGWHYCHDRSHCRAEQTIFDQQRRATITEDSSG